MHISITGRLGSGKSTVAKLIAANYGFEIYSTGNIIRTLAAEKGLSALQMNEEMQRTPNIDLELDSTTTRISKERAGDKLLFDSRMAWHFAVRSFKVYLYVDTEVAARRVLRDTTRGAVESYSSLEEAVNELSGRMNNEHERYMKLYHVDNFDFNNFDLVIDTAHRSPEEICALIMREFEVWSADPEGYTHPKMML